MQRTRCLSRVYIDTLHALFRPEKSLSAHTAAASSALQSPRPNSSLRSAKSGTVIEGFLVKVLMLDTKHSSKGLSHWPPDSEFATYAKAT